MPDAPATGLRFGILSDGVALQSWQTQCLEELKSVPGVQAVGTLGPEVGAPERLDFILCFAEGDVPAELIEGPRLGVWRFQLGDWVNYRGAPGGFWEVYDRCPASAAQLVRLQSDPNVVQVLREGFLRTQVLSVRKNREQLFARMVHWPAQVCAELRRKRTRASVMPASSPVESPLPEASMPLMRSGAALRTAPTLVQRAVLSARLAVRVAATGYRSLFRHDQWNIGIVEGPVQQFLTASAPPRVRWLPATPRTELRADPFGVARSGRATIFCEHYSYEDNRGYIVSIDPESDPDPARIVPSTRVRIGPEPPVHLSYPFLFEFEGRLLCVPESSEAQEIALYEAERFPDRWTRVATLVSGREYADATLFQYENRWWLAASDVADKGANSELHLWFADAPQGPWEPHAGNPVKIDVRSARPAGAPFWVDGVLYRPAQDCSSSYGARVTINRILSLSPSSFREEAAAVVNPDPRGAYPEGLHTLSSLGDQTLIDGKRSVFAPAEFLRVVRHYLP